MTPTKDIVFYIVNHLDTLGMEKGVEQVSHRLAFDRDYVLEIYFNEKRKAHQMAV
ncbi:hypothetical protein SAMN05192534_12418 [Alteribacillus persepolensis]|uniref:Uncharacterized protein n=1 Tax=Alteribacillus persepolensis TaxID=568899 RepID=A0A1G8IHE6_9BACI|nr:hypothetical protein [Alteribacillus persepolensis]SDI18181.1 hypothetical protein SAMN05192534_12418 [Alteribacillus persepolensis]